MSLPGIGTLVAQPPLLFACLICVKKARRGGPLNDQKFRELEFEAALVAITISVVSIPFDVPLFTADSTAELSIHSGPQPPSAI